MSVSATVQRTPHFTIEKQPQTVNTPNASATVQRTQATSAQTIDGKTISDDVPRPQGPARKCGCACKPECDCKCTCACVEHCVCRRESCRGRCGSRRSRNLVVSLDGTSNQFGVHNTNVVELHSRIIVDNATVDEQLTYYNCGIGTYVPNHRKTYKYLRQRLDNLVDLAIAWNFEDIVQKAYRWLSNVYQPGDKIFLIGFSRGAYQSRTLGAMIEKVGLVNAGNQELIPYAYEIYSERHKDAADGQAEAMATTFKNTFSRSVKVHFIGVWDTVSSVGIAREKPLPLTGSANHVCIFRHALALDEARVKFLPEYVEGGSSKTRGLREHTSDKVVDQPGLGPIGAPNPGNVKEVWFAGTHSDIGGGLKNNLNLNLSSVPLLWMENEATSAGLKLQPRSTGGGWNWHALRDDEGHDSTSFLWSVVEKLPIARLSFKNADEVTRVPHRGEGRKIVPGQLIHASVAFKSKDYRPKATFLRERDEIDWSTFVGQEIEAGTLDWATKLADRVDMDLFDVSFTIEAIESLKALWNSEDTSGHERDEDYWIQRLRFMALSGEMAANYVAALQQKRPEDTEREISIALKVFERLSAKYPTAFEGDVAELLEGHATAFTTLGQHEDARKAGEEATRIRRIMWIQAPSWTKLEKFANSLENLAMCPREANAGEALPLILEAVEIRRLITKSYVDPTPPGEPGPYDSQLSASLSNLAYIQYNLKHFEDAHAAAKDAVKLHRALRLTDTTELARLLYDLAVIQKAVGLVDEAVATHKEAADLRRGRAIIDPKAKPDLADSLATLATGLATRGDHTAAVEADREAVQLRRELASQSPTVDNRRALAEALHCLGIDLNNLGDHDDEVWIIGEETVALRRLVLTDSDSKQDLGHSLHNFGIYSRAIERAEIALTADRSALNVRRELLGEVQSTRADFATTVHNVALDLMLTGRNPDAVVLFQQELAGADVQMQLDLAGQLHALAVRLMKEEKHHDAIPLNEEALRVRLNALTDGSDMKQNIAMSSHNLAISYNVVGRYQEAITSSERAVGLRRELFTQNAEKRDDLLNSLGGLAIYLRRVGRHDAAVRIDEEQVVLLRQLPDSESTKNAKLTAVLHTLAMGYFTLGWSPLAAVEEELRLLKGMTEIDPENWNESLVLASGILAHYLRSMGRPSDSFRLAQETLNTQRSMADEAADYSQCCLVMALNSSAVEHSLSHLPDAALAASAECLRISEALAEKSPATYTRMLSNVLDTYANMLAGCGDYTGGLAAIIRAESIISEFPTSVDNRFAQGIYSSTRARCLLGIGDLDGLNALLESLELFSDLAAQEPGAIDEDDFSWSIGRILTALAALARGGVAPSDRVLTAMVTTVELCRKLVEYAPALFKEHLENCLACYSTGLSVTGRDREAADALNEAHRVDV